MALQNVEANITLDLYNHDTTPATVKAIQLDSQTRYVAAMLQSMGAQYDIDSGATVQLIVIRPDKVGVQITGTTFTYGDEGAQFLGPYAELTQVALAVNGKMRGQFKITSGDQILRTEIFAISNGEALDASTDEWADEYDGYNLEEMATSIETNTADIATLEADVSQIKEDFTDMVNSAYVTDSASGSVAHFVDGADDVPMKSVKVNIAPVQSGSGDPSPSNVRAISGWSSVKVTRAGKNLLRIYRNTGRKTTNGITYTVDTESGAVVANGTAAANADIIITDININLPCGTYVLSGGVDANVFIRMQVDGVLYQTSGGDSSSFTVTKDTVFGNCYCRVTSGTTVSDAVFKPMLRLTSDTDGTHEPYNGNTYTINLSSAGTVYGGTLDAVSGVLTVDKAIVDLGSLSWGYAESRFYSGSVTDGIAPSDTGDLGAVCEKYALYETGALASQPDFSFFVNSSKMSAGTKRIVIRDSNYTNAESLKTALNGVHLVYTLATPLIYQLSATEIKSLLGINNVWSDAGDMDVEYRADTKLYIDKRLAEVTA